MRIFLTILLTTFICCHSAFAASTKKLKGEEESKQKLEQLQQLLSRVTQGNTALPSATSQSAPQTTSPGQTFDALLNMPKAEAASGSAGLVSAPAVINTATDQISTDAKTTLTSDKDKVINSDANSTTNSQVAANTELPKPSVYDEAFTNVINQMLPMSSQQIAKLREVFNQTQLAVSTPSGIPPKPTSTALLINLAPQATPPVIRLGAGYVTSLVFVDATGQPWPIAAYSVGDSSSFDIKWNRQDKENSNTLLVQALTFYKSSNIAIMLRGLNTPVMVTLIAGQGAVDYRVDLRVPGLGPNAIYIANGIPESTNPVMLDVLNGIAPKGSKELKVAGGDCKAWLLNNKLYLRTNLNIVSPGWQSIMSSIDGTHAYQMQVAPVILALQKGRDKILTLKLEGLE